MGWVSQKLPWDGMEQKVSQTNTTDRCTAAWKLLYSRLYRSDRALCEINMFVLVVFVLNIFDTTRNILLQAMPLSYGIKILESINQFALYTHNYQNSTKRLVRIATGLSLEVTVTYTPGNN